MDLKPGTRTSLPVVMEGNIFWMVFNCEKPTLCLLE